MAAIPPIFGGGDPNAQVAQQAKMRQALAKLLIGGSGNGQDNPFAPVSHPMEAVAKMTKAGVGAYQQGQRKNALTGPMAQLGAPKGFY